MSLLVIEPAFQIVIGVSEAPRPFTEEEISRLRQMALDYEAVARRRPFDNHCLLAFSVCARTLDLPPELLRAKSRANTALTELRGHMMAFSRVVSERTKPVNGWSGIGRAFNRTHGAVMAATRKYGPAIEAALAI